MTLDELDRLAAERVMGWEFGTSTYLGVRDGIRTRLWRPNFRLSDLDIQDHETSTEGWLRPSDDRNLPPMQTFPHGEWRPTRSISQAWECLEKFSGQHPTYLIQVTYMPGSKCFECEICGDKKGNEYDIVWCENPTAPEAIVRACLKAKGVEL